jgi:hypothetical protein
MPVLFTTSIRDSNQFYSPEMDTLLKITETLKLHFYLWSRPDKLAVVIATGSTTEG